MTLRLGDFVVNAFGQPGAETGPSVPGPLPEVTADEARNGWTPEKLARYRQEMDRAMFNRVFGPKKKRPEMTARGYDPHGW